MIRIGISNYIHVHVIVKVQYMGVKLTKKEITFARSIAPN